MKLIFTWKEILIENGTTIIKRIPASCNVRNELNGKRFNNQVVYTYPEKGHRKPYYPRQFPSGIFEITSIEWVDPDNTKEYETYGLVKIRTT